MNINEYIEMSEKIEVPENVTNRFEETINTIKMGETKKINNTVDSQLSREKTKKYMKQYRPFLKVAIIVLTIFVAIPVGGYAANKFYQAYIVQKEGNKVEIHVSYEQKNDSVEEILEYEDVTFSFMPKDLYYNEEGPYERKYTNKEYPNIRGLSYALYRLSETGINDVTDMVSEANQWVTKNGNIAMYVERTEGWAQLWVAFSNTKYVVKIYADGFSDEEISKVADGVELTAAETDWSIEWEDLSEPMSYGDLSDICEESVIPDENIIWDTGDNTLNISTKNVCINVMDYHFEDCVPEDYEHPGKVFDTLKSDFSRSAFDENGNISDHYVYLVMHVMVQNNHDSEYEYLANSLSVYFGYTANNPDHVMNELFYSSAQKSEHPVTRLHYVLNANEVYEAYYYFAVNREDFENEKLLCMLLSDEDGGYVRDEDDYIIVLDKAKRDF